jgi:hypothetical protein
MQALDPEWVEAAMRYWIRGGALVLPDFLFYR